MINGPNQQYAPANISMVFVYNFDKLIVLFIEIIENNTSAYCCYIKKSWCVLL